MCVMTSGMAHVSGGIMGAYIAFGVEAKHLLAAVIMTAPGTILLAKMLVPETETPETAGTVQASTTERTDANVIGAAARGTSEGLHLALNVAAMLISFLALVALVNLRPGQARRWSGPLSLETILGYVFAPLALVMGVPWKDALRRRRPARHAHGAERADRLLASSGRMKATLDPRTLHDRHLRALRLRQLQLDRHPDRRHRRARARARGTTWPASGLRALLAGTLANFMTACIAGVLL